ncbi:hypothetical protein FF2_011077 [Malus domestica]
MNAAALTGGTSMGLQTMVHNPMAMHVSNMMSALGSSGASSGTGTMIPTPGMAQQVQSGMQSLGANNSSAAYVPFSQQTSALASALLVATFFVKPSHHQFFDFHKLHSSPKTPLLNYHQRRENSKFPQNQSQCLCHG